MKKLLCALSLLLAFVTIDAQIDSITFSDIALAKEYATDQDKSILMVFAGSDWCRPCMQFKKEVLEDEDFGDYASENLAILYLDFPSSKKNQLNEDLKKHHEALADQYNPYGAFPAILLIDKEEQIIGELEYKHQTGLEFITECRKVIGR